MFLAVVFFERIISISITIYIYGNSNYVAIYMYFYDVVCILTGDEVMFNDSFSTQDF